MKNLKLQTQKFMHICIAQPIVSRNLKFWTTTDKLQGKLDSEDPSASPESYEENKV